MPTIPNGRDSDKTVQRALRDAEYRRQAHQLLDNGTELADLPVPLLFALAPSVKLRPVIEAWLTSVRNKPAEIDDLM
jgi:hypothetical protein